VGVRLKAAAAGSGGQGAGPFGVDVGGAGGVRHVVYVLDVSLSMETRMGRARDELANAITALTSDESFDIECFGEVTHRFSNHLVPADPKDISDALRFLMVQPLMEGTNLGDAMRKALSIDGVNEIVVITDGVPTVGETNFGRLARMVQKLNQDVNARIDTVGLVGKNPDGTDDSFQASQLLNEIARDSGGASKLVTVGIATPD